MIFRILLPILALAFYVSQITLLNSDPAEDHAPAWSPDGSRIAYLRSEIGPSEIYSVDTSGNLVTLHSGTPAAFPVWSPDGGRIAYLENGPQGHSIHVMNSDGSQDQRILERSSTIHTLAWSPTGEKIASWSNGELFVVRPDGSEFEVLDDDGATDVWPTWSPDGNQIAFVRGTNASENREIVVVEANGNDSTVIIERPAIVTVDWSPIGDKIAFVYREGNQNELALINSDGHGFTRLIANIAVEPDIAWSPDGERITYSHADDLYTVSSDGSQNYQEGTDAGREFVPLWSPDGNWLAYFSAGYASLSINASTNAGNIMLFDIPTAQLDVEEYLSWSPDSARIAFHGYPLPPDLSLYSMRVDGSEVTRLSTDLPVDGFSWSPNGQQIAFVSDDLYVVDVNGDNLTKLTANLAIASFDWSPVGNQLAFTSDGIYVVNADGTNMIQLVASGTGSAGAAKWSPDGRKLVFTMNAIHVIDADGSNLTRLHEGIYPAWSPDGQRIAFMRRWQVKDELYVMDSNGDNVIQLTHNGGELPGIIPPVWSPDGSRIMYSSSGSDDSYLSELGPDIANLNSPFAIPYFTISVIDADGSTSTPIGSYSYLATPVLPVWSPDGRWIASNDSGYIVLRNGDGSPISSIDGWAPEAHSPSWAPDGRHFVFASNLNISSDLYVLSLNH